MPPGVGYPARRAPMLSEDERRRAQALTGRSDIMPRAGGAMPAPAVPGAVQPPSLASIGRNFMGGGLGRLRRGAQGPGNPWTIINPTYDSFDWRDPAGAMKLFEKQYGAEDKRLSEVDPAIFEALQQRSVAETGARSRAALGGLRSSAAGAGPGQYGFLAALSDLQSGSDLSRASSDAYLQEAGRAREYREGRATNYLDFIQQQQQSARDFEQQAELARLGSGLAERRARAGRGRGLSLRFPGGAGGAVSFQTGGVATEPTRAIIGDAGEPEYVLRESQLLDLLSGGEGGVLGGRDLIRARTDAAREGVGTLGGGPGMGPSYSGMDSQGAPEPPIPYREPEAVKPQGFWESLAAYMPEVSAAEDASGGAHALALLANIARIPGATSMRRRGAQNERTKAFVDDLNKGQAMKYDAELDDYRYGGPRTRRNPGTTGPGRRSMQSQYLDENEIYIPEIDEFVKKGGTVHNRYLQERLMQTFRTPKGNSPKKETTPKRSAGLTTAVNYWKKRLLNVTMGADMRVMADELRAEPDSIRSAPEVQEALRLKMREFGLSK